MPSVTRTEEEIGVELAALWKTVSSAGQFVDVPVPQVMEDPTMKQFDDMSCRRFGRRAPWSGATACPSAEMEPKGQMLESRGSR